MKKFINKVENVESEMISGLIKAYPDKIKKLDGCNVVVRANKKQDKVAIITGGGSGHEPGYAGYVGEGMLDAAVAGNVYTSPTPDQVYEAIKAVATDKGVLMIVMNYTGDIMNFEMAQELAMADGIKVEMVVTNDDVAVENSLYTVGRRGVCGTVLVDKITCALAEKGAELSEVKAMAEKVNANIRTMGVAINPSTVPAAGKPGYELNEDEMEVGIGIHGEPGIYKEKLKSANEIVDMLLEKILADLDYSNSEVAVIVNGSGGTPLMELFIVNDYLNDALTNKGIKVYKTYVGNYLTSLDQEGISISLLKLNDEMKELLNAKADSPAFKE